MHLNAMLLTLLMLGAPIQSGCTGEPCEEAQEVAKAVVERAMKTPDRSIEGQDSAMVSLIRMHVGEKFRGEVVVDECVYSEKQENAGVWLHARESGAVLRVDLDKHGESWRIRQITDLGSVYPQE